MAPIAVTQIMPNSPAPANAAAAPDIDTVFANLLAGMAPVAQTSAPSAQISAPAQIPAPQMADLPANIPLPANNAQLPADETKIALQKKIPANAPANPNDDVKPDTAPLLANLAAPGKPLEPAKAKDSAKEKESTTPDPAAMPVIFAAPNTPAPIKPVQTADAIIGDVTKAAKPALAAAPVAPEAAKPDSESKSTAPAKDAPQAKADPATLPAAAHINVKPAPAPQTAQAQPAHANPSVKTADTNAQGGNSQKQDRRDAPQQAQTAQTQSDPAPQSALQSAPPPAHAPAPQAPVQAHTSQAAPQASAIAASANVQPAQSAPVHVSASLQVSAQNDAQPNIGDIAVTIAAKSHAGEKHFDIRLDPPELGRIDVHLSVDDSGKAQAHLTADKPQTLELLQRDSTDLQRALKDAGVDLGNNGLNFSLKGEQRQAGQSPQRGNGRARALSVNAIAAQSANPVRSYAPGSVQLDIRV